MKRRIAFILLLMVFFFTCNNTVIAPMPTSDLPRLVYELVYEYDGSLYHAVERQCDATPLITGSGFQIDPTNASNQRILAVSPDLLNDPDRRQLAEKLGYIKDDDDKRFLGELSYGDSVYVQSPKDSLGNYIYPNLNGWWYVEDAKNPRYRNSNIKLDFLQTLEDKSLYNNDSMWNGRFEGVKIYKIRYYDRV